MEFREFEDGDCSYNYRSDRRRRAVSAVERGSAGVDRRTGAVGGGDFGIGVSTEKPDPDFGDLRIGSYPQAVKLYLVGGKEPNRKTDSDRFGSVRFGLNYISVQTRPHRTLVAFKP